MLGLRPIASSAIASLPDYLLSDLSAVFTGLVTYEALPYSPYLALVNGQGTRIAYSIELHLRVVR